MMNWNEYEYDETPDWIMLGKKMMSLGHLPFDSSRAIELALENKGIKRYKIVKHDCRNVDIFISPKDHDKIDGMIASYGIEGVRYNIKQLGLFECRFQNFKIWEGANGRK